MSPARLPAHLLVTGLLRLAETGGGFGTVLHRGERDAGTIGVVVTERGSGGWLYERMPRADGKEHWVLTRESDPENLLEFSDSLSRRASRDPDWWLLELDVPHRERFVAELGTLLD